jgi:hypothetical protein
MTKEEYLLQYRDALRQEAQMKELIDVVEARIYAAKSVSASMIGSLKTPHDPMKKVDSFLDKKKSFLYAQERTNALMSEILDTIQSIPDSRLRSILREHYILLHPWERIASDWGVDVRTAYRWKSAALDALTLPETA